MKILVVNPSRVLQQILLTRLSDAGVEAVFVATGQAGLNRLLVERFDLLSVALHLPDMSGLEFRAAARDLDNARNVPIALLTSNDDRETQVTGLEAGITEVFRKSELDRFVDYLRDMKADEQARRRIEGRVLLVARAGTLAQYPILDSLRDLGVTVQECRTGEEVMALMAQEEPDLVLTEVLLDGEMTALGVLRAIRRAAGRCSRLPVLVLSSLDDVARRIELLRHGANDYLSLPAIPEELAARLGNLLQNTRLLDTVEAQQAHLRTMAMTDQLTALYNRHYLVDVAAHKLAEAHRHGWPVSLVVIDLDHFKRINDSHGHLAGDLVLSEVAEALREHCRPEDVAARMGGEEFVLLLPHCPHGDALIKAEQLRAVIEAAQPGGIRVTASMGVATLPAEVVGSFEKLFQAADEAVYVAKESGRNRIVSAEDRHAPLSAAVTLSH